MVESNSESGNSEEMYKETPLTNTEAWHLTLYKWRYSLEAGGFKPDEIRELMFLKWMYASKRLAN